MSSPHYPLEVFYSIIQHYTAYSKQDILLTALPFPPNTLSFRYLISVNHGLELSGEEIRREEEWVGGWVGGLLSKKNQEREGLRYSTIGVSFCSKRAKYSQ